MSSVLAYKPPGALLLAAAVLIAAAPARGQTLDERIAAVKLKRAREAQKADLPDRVKLLQALLYTRLTVSFDRTPARDVFDYLKTALGVNLIVRYSDDAVGHGIDPETAVSVSVKDLAAIEVLDLVLEQCATVEECTWQLRDGFLEAGTKERLSVPAAREIRWYPIGDLVYEPPMFDDAISLRLDTAYPWYGGSWGYYGGYSAMTGGYGGGIQFVPATPPSSGLQSDRVESVITLITQMIEPAAWTANGGDWASINHRDDALVVNAPDYIHRQIAGYPPVPRP